MNFVNSTNIRDYVPILVGMGEDWDLEHYPYILAYCGILPIEDFCKFLLWKVWLVYENDVLIGICGIYEDASKNRCWMGWFGVLPEYRKLRYGRALLDQMETVAFTMGFDNLFCYCSDDPLQYYINNGYQRIGNVKELIEINGKEEPLLKEFLGEDDNHVIKKVLK